MQFSSVLKLSNREKSDLLVLLFWQGEKKAKAAHPLGEFQAAVQTPLDLRDFQGREGEVLFIYAPNGSKERRIALLGLGKQEKLCSETLRIAFGQLTRACNRKGIEQIHVLLPPAAEMRHPNIDETLRGIGEGMMLANYRWDEKNLSNEKKNLLKSVTFIGLLPKKLEILEEIKLVAEAVYLARDLINGGADHVTPSFLIKTAEKIADRFPTVKTTILDKKRLEHEKMGLLLAVGRGSSHDPALIIMSYQGVPKSKDHTVLVGKGVTFDTGGLNLKPTGSMETMRDDMSGAAAVMATVAAAASLQLKVNVTAVAPICENAIDAKSFKPGDVYRGFLGKSVEIGNTDAEGRLILADALAYSVKNLEPTRLIDVATLTGSIVVGIGDEIAGLFSNDEKLASELLAAGQSTGELLCQLPLHAPYKELLKSDIADIKNIGGRAGGPILAALFLEEFVGGTRWAHLDIAGPAFGSKERPYLPKNGIGYGIRLLLEDLKRRAK